MKLGDFKVNITVADDKTHTVSIRDYDRECDQLKGLTAEQAVMAKKLICIAFGSGHASAESIMQEFIRS